MNKKRFWVTLAAVAVLACQSLMAKPVYLNVELNDKRVESYALASQPALSFADGSMLIKGNDIEASYVLGQVARYFFTDEPAKVSLPTAASDFRFTYLTPDNIDIELRGPIAVTLYDINGRVVKQTSGTDCITLSISDLEEGTYVVRINNSKSIKIFRK